MTERQPLEPRQRRAIATDLAIASKGTRAGAFLIDVVPALFLGLVGIVPIAGPIFAGLLLAPYWLLRDVFGGSPGKRLLGLRIVGHEGRPATNAQRVARNLPLAFGPALLVIPILGMFLGPPVSGVIILLESILFLTRGHRLGDTLAGTSVTGREE